MLEEGDSADKEVEAECPSRYSVAFSLLSLRSSILLSPRQK